MSTLQPTRDVSGRRCLITGARGFLGRPVVRRICAAGFRVTVLVRTEAAGLEFAGLDQLVGDMTDPSWAAKVRNGWRWDDVVHLAGSVPAGSLSFAEEAKFARLHPLIALAMASAIPRDWAGRIVHASSMTVYGAAPRLPVKESQPLEPAFLYALGKVLAEDVWRAFPERDCWLLRFPGLFSASRKAGALYHFVRAAREGRPIRINATSPTLWDIMHVEDAAEAVVRALASARPFQGAMNVSYGEVVQLEQVAHRVAALAGGSEVINETGVQHPPFQLDIELAKERLAWPPCGLDARLAELVSDSSGPNA
jgi:nucleoside-diphosphate-sugar epimerase